MESLIFLVETRDKNIKGRACANGSSQQEYMERDQAATSPTTTMTESVMMITATIDAKQRCAQYHDGRYIQCICASGYRGCYVLCHFLKITCEPIII